MRQQSLQKWSHLHCQGAEGKATYECYCAPGYGGPICDQRPCDVNPCLHNGTCRTTAGFSSYFCDCKEGYGGKNCDIGKSSRTSKENAKTGPQLIVAITVPAISKKPPEERYGSKVLLVSSGKEEWIQQMKERLGGKKKTTPAPVADEPYKG
ncbi:EGF-like domain protein [Ancylostoma duodenale]|uniref:EGF-like domain protein n=1 Tax=Ancylostoma duodenale TaxID=51022 RepID=A0A0C2GAD6_9BILA|nr:EGF-like domain protein [Ancylostoma duodenale]